MFTSLFSVLSPECTHNSENEHAARMAWFCLSFSYPAPLLSSPLLVNSRSLFLSYSILSRAICSLSPHSLSLSRNLLHKHDARPYQGHRHGKSPLSSLLYCTNTRLTPLLTLINTCICLLFFHNSFPLLRLYIPFKTYIETGCLKFPFTRNTGKKIFFLKKVKNCSSFSCI